MFARIRKWFGRPRNPAGNVYYARLNTPQGTFYKIGYTAKSSLTERLAYAGFEDEKLLDQELLFAFRKDAWDVEWTLLDHFNKQRAFGKYSKDPAQPLCGRGQSELFRHDVLGLDEDLYTIPELSKETDDASKGAALGMLLIFGGVVIALFTAGVGLILSGFGAYLVYESAREINKKGCIPIAPHRPQHPPKIKELIESLTSAHKRTGECMNQADKNLL